MLQREKYIYKYKELHVEDPDPIDRPFVPKVALIANDDRRNGRTGVHIDFIQTSSLPRIMAVRAMSTNSCPNIEPCPVHSEVMCQWLSHLGSDIRAIYMGDIICICDLLQV